MKARLEHQQKEIAYSDSQKIGRDDKREYNSDKKKDLSVLYITNLQKSKNNFTQL